MQSEQHFTQLTEALAASEAAPLSAKKAMLAVLLADACADRLAGPAEDVLAFRATLAARSEALALVFDLAAMRDGGARLVTEAVEVPLAEYGLLKVEDFMVSLYNQHTVQRVRVALPDGGRRDVHELLREAVAALRALSNQA